MTRTQSVRRGWNARHVNRVADSSRRSMARGGITTVLCALGISLGWTAVCAAASGPGIGLKVGAQTLEDPISLDKTTRTRFELEISSPLLCDDYLDLAFTFGGSSLGSVSDYYADVYEDVLIEESYTDDLFMLDVRVAARLYPFGYNNDLRPYVGAGVGYFWFFDQWEYEYAETFEDPLFPGTFYTFVDGETGTDTMAQGFFPFVLAGLTVPIGDNFELMLEFQYDFAKEDEGIDLGGPIYMIGGRFRF